MHYIQEKNYMNTNSFQKGDKYLWILPKQNNDFVLEISKAYNLSFPIAQTLINRGFSSKQEIESFLFSSFEKDVFHPSLLKDAQKAVERIIYAIDNKEKILIFGDYDVDGITSSSLMMLCLTALGAQVNFFLPHRVKDGYGISASIVERAAKNNYKLIITVDNGITAFEAADKAKELNIDLIITDHHKPHDTIPEAFAIVNPNQEDCSYPYKYFAGVGVSFKILSLLYEKKGLKIPDKAYELLLLGTIADVVPLTGENRYWVRHGLNYIAKNESLSLKLLKQNSKLEKLKLSSKDVGFNIAPQINALGRLQDPRQGVKFLIGADERDAEITAKVLFELNQARKEIERSILNEIDAEIKSKRIDLENENIILAASNNWPPGVIGLVASRLVAEYGKPTLLFHLTNDGKAKGSCRSIVKFNIFDALNESKDLIDKFGGHALAAGLSLDIENLSKLKNNLEKKISEQLDPIDLQPKILLDAHARLEDFNLKFISDLEYLEPFGNQNDCPTFYIKDVTLVQKPMILKDLHVKCFIFAQGIIKNIIFFNRPDLFEKLQFQNDEPFDIAAQVTQNYWNGKTNVELIGFDVAGLKK